MSKMYDAIQFKKYRIDRPRDISKVYQSKYKSYLEGKLKILAKVVSEYILKRTVTTGSNYKVCIIFTKHYLCVGIFSDIRNKIMYYFDIDVDVDLEDKNKDMIIKEIKVYKINNGNVPNLNFIEKGHTVGYAIGNPGDVMPEKLPIIGISNKKLFLPKLSFFIEGPHINLYKQNYIFDWKYYVDESLGINNASDISNYNKNTENVDSQGAFGHYGFN